jgi:catechol 2,3-dioxygenase-like lactoylglutathione lyase family enzyme
MPETKTSVPATERGFRVGITHHPRHYVADLAETEDFFTRVFGRPSIPIDEVLKRVAYVIPNFPRNYSAYTAIADIFFDSLDPERVVFDGKQFIKVRRTPPHLDCLGWYVEGHTEAYRALRSNGFTILNSIGEKQERALPTGPNDPAPFYTIPEETGVIYAFYPEMVFPCDARTEPGWVLPPVSDDDPLGIERCSHHTFLTDQPERATRILVDILGGDIFHEGRNEELGANTVCIRLGDSSLEFATPDEGTPAYEDWAVEAPCDTYHSITFKVVDLERAERHLDAQGVRIRQRWADGFVTDPATSLGIPWGFFTTLLPGDPRSTTSAPGDQDH